jgi:uncharacterized protein
MTPQEQQLLETFLTQLVEVKGIEKDPAANALIAQSVARQPDAAYLLVQRSLLLSAALDDAQARIAQLEAAAKPAQAAPAAGGFLDPNAWGRRGGSVTPITAGATSVTGAALGRPGVAAAAAHPAMAAAPQGGRSSFLGNAASMAAGVVGGAFLFQGINHMMNSGANSQHAKAQEPSASALSEPLAEPLVPLNDDASFDSASNDAYDDGGAGDDSSYS